MASYLVECNNCKHWFHCNGTEDFESVGDGGPACSTGIELHDCSCPECGKDDVDIKENVSDYDDE